LFTRVRRSHCEMHSIAHHAQITSYGKEFLQFDQSALEHTPEGGEGGTTLCSLLYHYSHSPVTAHSLSSWWQHRSIASAIARIRLPPHSSDDPFTASMITNAAGEGRGGGGTATLCTKLLDRYLQSLLAHKFHIVTKTCHSHCREITGLFCCASYNLTADTLHCSLTK
jgi:hypothetical protein